MTPEFAAEMIDAAGLDPDRFDAEETAADLTARTEMSATLDALVVDQDAPALQFDPSW